MNRIVIIGAGECGVRAAFSLREQGYADGIVLIGDETSLPYERPPLSKEHQGNPKLIRSREAYEAANIDLRLGTLVGDLDASLRRLRLTDGETLGYDKLLLATGARARLFSGMEGCLTLRTSMDEKAISARIGQNTRVGIVGGGFIGLELAARARKAGAEVTVIEAAARLLGRAVPAEISEIVQSRHEAEGVRILLKQGVRSTDAQSVTLTDGSALSFDTVIVGVGSVPNTEIAQEAGLVVDNGIVVDGELRTSDPHIFAAGDCCNFAWRGTHMRLESWKAAQDQGAHAAAAMLGACRTYTKVPWFWSDQFDLTLQVAGIFDHSQPVLLRSCDNNTHIVLQCDADNRLVAAAAIGLGNSTSKDIRILEKLMERAAIVEPDILTDPTQNLKLLLRAA